jgi:hypothetical protein
MGLGTSETSESLEKCTIVLEETASVSKFNLFAYVVGLLLLKLSIAHMPT